MNDESDENSQIISDHDVSSTSKFTLAVARLLDQHNTHRKITMETQTHGTKCQGHSKTQILFLDLDSQLAPSHSHSHAKPGFIDLYLSCSVVDRCLLMCLVL